MLTACKDITVLTYAAHRHSAEHIRTKQERKDHNEKNTDCSTSGNDDDRFTLRVRNGYGFGRVQARRDLCVLKR